MDLHFIKILSNFSPGQTHLHRTNKNVFFSIKKFPEGNVALTSGCVAPLPLHVKNLISS